MIAILLIAWSVTVAESAEPSPGEICGVVVNASQGGKPCAHAEVMLRVRKDGRFVPVEQTVTDGEGRFRFADLPLGRNFLYLPGANWHDVHYPGSRVSLTGANPHSNVTLQVHDPIQAPCPLVIKRQDIIIQPEAGVLRVTEAIRVSNPTSRTYVGRAEKQDAPAVTLRLSIPREFERTTFFQEFYGRQFFIADGQLATGIPWTPGERDLGFTYTIPNDQSYRLWQRPLDLPCENFRVRILHDKLDEISCNLDPSSRTAHGERIFSSRGEPLPAGYVVRVELGKLPVPWTAYGRWGALLVLVGLIAGTGILLVRRKRGQRWAAASAAVPLDSLRRPPESSRKERRRAA